jgi:hypothetical protein
MYGIEVLPQQARASLILKQILAITITGCAVGIEIEDGSPWQY